MLGRVLLEFSPFVTVISLVFICRFSPPSSSFLFSIFYFLSSSRLLVTLIQRFGHMILNFPLRRSEAPSMLRVSVLLWSHVRNSLHAQTSALQLDTTVFLSLFLALLFLSPTETCSPYLHLSLCFFSLQCPFSTDTCSTARYLCLCLSSPS